MMQYFYTGGWGGGSGVNGSVGADGAAAPTSNPYQKGGIQSKIVLKYNYAVGWGRVGVGWERGGGRTASKPKYGPRHLSKSEC